MRAQVIDIPLAELQRGPLPPVCIRTGQPTARRRTVNLKVPTGASDAIVTVILTAILSMLGGFGYAFRTVKVQLPLVSLGVWPRLAKLLGTLVAVVACFVIPNLIFSGTEDDPNPVGQWLGVTLATVALAYFVYLCLPRNRFIRVRRRGMVRFRAHPNFVAAWEGSAQQRAHGVSGAWAPGQVPSGVWQPGRSAVPASPAAQTPQRAPRPLGAPSGTGAPDPRSVRPPSGPIW